MITDQTAPTKSSLPSDHSGSSVSILGLDMSSVCIGWCLVPLNAPPVWGHFDMHSDIAQRCKQASDSISRLLDDYAPALVVIESPVVRFAKSALPQARVSGAVLAVLAQRSALWVEVTPSAAKQVLAGSGSATKAEMVEAARRRLNLSGVVLSYRSKFGLWMDGRLHFTEDEADAYALALCGAAMRIVTKGVAA